MFKSGLTGIGTYWFRGREGQYLFKLQYQNEYRSCHPKKQPTNQQSKQIQLA